MGGIFNTLRLNNTYKPLAQSDDDQPSHETPPPRFNRLLKPTGKKTTSPLTFLALPAAILLLLLLLLLLLFTGNSRPLSTSTSTPAYTSIPDPQFCGVTVAEARAANCAYDKLAHLWLPPQCQHAAHAEKLYLEYDDGRPFKYWMDDQMAEEVDISLLPPGTIVYSKRKEHLAHCAFTLLRTSEWMRSGGHWERKVLDPNHFDHCVELLLNATRYHPALDDVGASALLGFSGRCYSRVVL
jgi:hypothetical protein